MSKATPAHSDTTKSSDPLAEIDDEIARLEERLAYLRSHRNTLIPMALIPSEIIIKIFMEAVTLRIFPRQVDRVQLLRMTWVSRQWRTVALECATLWTHIHGTNLQWINESIRRSSQAPLTMNLFIANSTTKGASSCLQYLPRVLELKAHVTATPAQQSNMFHLWKSPAPLLQYLEIQHATIPDDLFSGDAPSLQTVSLWDCRFEIRDMPFTSVKELTIMMGQVWQSPSMFSILSKLQEMPLLLKLRLSHILGGEDNLPFVNLLNLESLNLYQPQTRIAAAFVKHLSYPAKTKIRVEFTNIPERREFLEVLEAAERSFNSKTTLNTLEAVSSMSRYISFTHTSESGDKNSALGEGSGNITLDRPTGSLSELFQLVSGPRLQTLATLSVMQDEIIDTETWRDVFSQLPSLRALQLESHPADHFVSYLVQYHPRSKSDIQSNPLIPFPALDKLEFDWTISHRTIFNGIDYRTLRDVFALRQELGKRMKYWYIPQNTWTSSVVEMMQPFVEELEVEDHRDHAEEEDDSDSAESNRNP